MSQRVTSIAQLAEQPPKPDARGIVSLKLTVVSEGSQRNSIKDDAVKGKLPHAKPTADLPLTARQIECLQYLADGLNISEISKLINISLSTVKFHLRCAIERLNASNRCSAIYIASKKGII